MFCFQKAFMMVPGQVLLTFQLWQHIQPVSSGNNGVLLLLLLLLPFLGLITDCPWLSFNQQSQDSFSEKCKIVIDNKKMAHLPFFVSSHRLEILLYFTTQEDLGVSVKLGILPMHSFLHSFRDQSCCFTLERLSIQRNTSLFMFPLPSSLPLSPSSHSPCNFE